MMKSVLQEANGNVAGRTSRARHIELLVYVLDLAEHSMELTTLR